MPKYKCKDCGAIWYGWEAKENPICQKCGGKLEPVPEYTLLKNRPGPARRVNREKRIKNKRRRYH